MTPQDHSLVSYVLTSKTILRRYLDPMGMRGIARISSDGVGQVRKTLRSTAQQRRESTGRYCNGPS